MKKLLLSITILSSLFGYSQLAIETFSGATFPPTGWTTATGVVARPWGFTTTIFNATGQATYNINGTAAAINWIAAANDAHLTTPAFSLAGYSDANLLFKAKVGWSYMIDLDAGDLIVQVSTNGGTTWDDIWFEEDGGWQDDGDADPDSDLYDTQEITVDMTAYVGQANVLVRFRYLAENADAISIDDVAVTGTLGVNENLASKFSTYPNPANSVVNVSNTYNIILTNVDIKDINGRTVKSMKVNNLSDIQMDVFELSSGVYFMNIDTDSGVVIKKFIKS